MTFKETLAKKTFALVMTWGAIALVVMKAQNFHTWVSADNVGIAMLRLAAIMIPVASWIAFWAVTAEELDCAEARIHDRRARLR